MSYSQQPPWVSSDTRDKIGQTPAISVNYCKTIHWYVTYLSQNGVPENPIYGWLHSTVVERRSVTG